MAELVPAPFADLVTRLYVEPKVNDVLFGLPRRKWFAPDMSGPYLTVRFHGRLAGNASGTAAGPQTQMAQNLLLSYIAGGRILELKTVQVNDRLTIGRPCIDVTNIGYNIEWSQELLVEQSLREYVAGAMLIEMFRRDPAFAGNAHTGPAGEVLYDISLGYDLAGIQSAKVQRFLDGMSDAKALVEQLRGEIPEEYKLAGQLDYPTHLSDSVTLSTFHGCPANEIEKICEFLIGQRGLDVIVKMNPPMLGKDRLEHLLYDVLGYTELKVNPTAYTTGLQFDESVELCARLMAFAARHGRKFGAKFSNTLEVLNHRTFFTQDNKIQYLSGQPLHVITMALTDVWRQAVGPEVPISFSAGIDSKNFPLAVACGFVPVTTCTDLLRPGGYGRLPAYLKALCDAMKAVAAPSVDGYIRKAFGNDRPQDSLQQAALLNTSIIAEKARQDARYRAPQNRAVPKRIDSHLVIFDCITCDKCIPVCPNAANFTYPTPPGSFEYQDVLVDAAGHRWAEERKKFEIDKDRQIANYADFCNECGNCDTFCPEYDGPYIKKPGFYGSVESWQRAAPRDGFVVQAGNSSAMIRGRIRGAQYQLVHQQRENWYCYDDGVVLLTLSGEDHAPTKVDWLAEKSEHRIDMGTYHTLRYLLAGILDAGSVHQVNVGTLQSV